MELYKEANNYLTASYLSKKLNVSLRTIQSDLKIIRELLDKEECAKIVATVSKGTCLEIKNQEEFSAFLNNMYLKQAHLSLAYPANRILQISIYLLNKHRSVSVNALADDFYVSISTLNNDLKKLHRQLSEFELDLLKNDNKVLIFGSEINKRRFIVEKFFLANHAPVDSDIDYADEKQIPFLKNLLTEALIAYKYSVADTEIQNAILLLNIMVKRMQKGFYINPNELDISTKLDIEEKISEYVFNGVKRHYVINITDYEVKYFALYLKGKSNCQNTSMITTEMDNFILASFQEINNKFGIDFTNNINLRMALALHCIPLEIRLMYNMQMNNSVLDYIKQIIPLGYDIAIFFALLLEKRYGGKLSEVEISLIAVHFYSSLLEDKNKTGTKRVLVISSMKNSMTLLLRQTLQKWFSEKISKLEFMDEMEITDEVLDEYDIFLTTEKKQMYENGVAMFINAFPEDQDYVNIKLLFDGFKNAENILQIFDKHLFFVNNEKSKQDVLQKLCEKANQKFRLEDLYKEVMKREERGSTCFVEGVAVPHPMYAVSSDTFAVVSVLKEEMEWDAEGNRVQLVVMICIGKNNPQAFHLWDYIAKIFADRSLASKMAAEPNYEKFVSIVRNSLKDKMY